MKIKNIKITLKDHGKVMAEFAEALGKARRGETIEQHQEVSFETIGAWWKFFTDKRLELLHVIKQKEPDSIYELAQFVDRDFKSVSTDLAILNELGLISLEKTHDERERVKPIIEFEKINMEIAI